MSHNVLAFNFMGPEMIWIVLLLLLLFGAKKLPQLARGIGESIGEFRKARKEFEDEVSVGEKSAQKPASSTPAAAKAEKPQEPVAAAVAPREDHA
jgi:sec-independent protein translocase protein TatA